MDDNNSNMVGAFAVSNEMLYELLRDLKSDMNRRFAEIDKRFDDVDRRFAEVDKRLDSMDGKLGLVYESRDKVTVNFTRTWAFASLVIATMASGFSLLLVKGA